MAMNICIRSTWKVPLIRIHLHEYVCKQFHCLFSPYCFLVEWAWAVYSGSTDLYALITHVKWQYIIYMIALPGPWNSSRLVGSFLCQTSSQACLGKNRMISRKGDGLKHLTARQGGQRVHPFARVCANAHRETCKQGHCLLQIYMFFLFCVCGLFTLDLSCLYMTKIVRLLCTSVK